MNTATRSAAVCGKASADRATPQPRRARFVASALFRKLITNVNRHRLATDRVYFGLVSAIAELLSDEEVVVLALYLAPQLAAGACFRAERAAVPALRHHGVENHA